jgi:DNA polymerase
MAGKTSAAAHPADPNQENPPIESLAEARLSVQACRRCDLYANATQAVFGEGPAHARIVFVGEQPGDQEDLAGKPFVGPAGRLFDQCLEHVGIDRKSVYVTNAVKHFKFEPRGKRRLHKRPDIGEIAACHFWLELETEFLDPAVIVALGATAARSILGKAVTIGKLRGAPIERGNSPPAFVTIHPSYLLRIRDREDARREREAFEADLAVIRDLAAGH